jgi:hypothetical protein
VGYFKPTIQPLPAVRNNKGGQKMVIPEFIQVKAITGKFTPSKFTKPRVQKPNGTIAKITHTNVSLNTTFYKDVEDGRWCSFLDHERLVQK